MARYAHLHANFNYQSIFGGVLGRHMIYICAVTDLKLTSLRSCSKVELHQAEFKSLGCPIFADKSRVPHQPSAGSQAPGLQGSFCLEQLLRINSNLLQEPPHLYHMFTRLGTGLGGGKFIFILPQSCALSLMESPVKGKGKCSFISLVT